MQSIFEEFGNRKVESLSREAGEKFNCFYCAEGLPNKVIYRFHGSLMGDPDARSDLGITMQLVATNDTGKKLEHYLTEKLGLVSGEDFCRHANDMRGGAIYFDIVTDKAIEILNARAELIGKQSATEREAARPKPSRSAER